MVTIESDEAYYERRAEQEHETAGPTSDMSAKAIHSNLATR